MNKDRLDWIMSGLNQYALTNAEDRLVKAVVVHFDQHLLLTGHQEERIETLYKEKSKQTPNKKSDSSFSLGEAPPKRVRPRRPPTKLV